jgi:hypothetical protein
MKMAQEKSNLMSLNNYLRLILQTNYQVVIREVMITDLIKLQTSKVKSLFLFLYVYVYFGSFFKI